MSVKLNIVVAACSNGGIGIEGKLPWNLKKDRAFFRNITSTVHENGETQGQTETQKMVSDTRNCSTRSLSLVSQSGAAYLRSHLACFAHVRFRVSRSQTFLKKKSGS